MHLCADFPWTTVQHVAYLESRRIDGFGNGGYWIPLSSFFCYKRQKTQNLINKLLSAFPVHDSEILVACKTAGCEPLTIKSCVLKFTSYLANVSGIDFFSFPVINFHFYFQTPKPDKVAHRIKFQKYELFFYNSIYFGYYRTSLSCVWLNANGCPYLFPIWP